MDAAENKNETDAALHVERSGVIKIRSAGINRPIYKSARETDPNLALLMARGVLRSENQKDIVEKRESGGKGGGIGAAKSPGLVRKSLVCGASRIRDRKGERRRRRGGDIRASEEFRVHGIARGVKISLPSRLLFSP